MAEIIHSEIDEAFLDQIARMEYPCTWPCPWQLWRHYKGGLYHVLIVAVRESNGEPEVVYQGKDSGHVWIRPVSDWLEKVWVDGQYRDRFERVAS